MRIEGFDRRVRLGRRKWLLGLPVVALVWAVALVLPAAAAGPALLKDPRRVNIQVEAGIGAFQTVTITNNTGADIVGGGTYLLSRGDPDPNHPGLYVNPGSSSCVTTDTSNTGLSGDTFGLDAAGSCTFEIAIDSEAAAGTYRAKLNATFGEGVRGVSVGVVAKVTPSAG